MDDAAYDRTVAAFYSAAAGRTEWAVVLDDLATSLDAWATPLMGVDKRTGTMLFTHHGGPAAPAVALDYMRGYHAIDPRAQLLMSLPYGAWVHCHEHFDERYVSTHPFYQEFLLPHGGRYVSGRKVFEDDETVMVLGLHRPAARGPFRSEEHPMLYRLGEHVEHAMRIYRRLREKFAEASAARELLDQFAQPMLLLDELGGIRFRNTAAGRAIAQGDLVTDRSGILTCVDAASQAELMSALQHLGLQGATRNPASADRRWLRIRRPGARAAVVANLVAVRPETSLRAFGPSPAALVLLHDPVASRDLDPFLVAEIFGLSPAEARVAVALRAGHSVQVIAQAHRTALPTIRSQVQSIFAKTGVHRQADLVRMLEDVAGFEALADPSS